MRSNLNILSGWRFEEFGRDAVDLVEGRLYHEEAILDRLASEHPYDKWLGNMVDPKYTLGASLLKSYLT